MEVVCKSVAGSVTARKSKGISERSEAVRWKLETNRGQVFLVAYARCFRRVLDPPLTAQGEVLHNHNFYELIETFP